MTSSDVTISVTAVPDSVLQNVGPRTEWKAPYYEMNVFSPVINFSIAGILLFILFIIFMWLIDFFKKVNNLQLKICPLLSILHFLWMS